MPRSMRQAVISCLYKKGEREDITNWRPISLLNYDNEIYTKILAKKNRNNIRIYNRSRTNSSYKGRTIIKNLQLNRDVMSYANANKIQAAMIALDQKKHLIGWTGIFSLKPTTFRLWTRNKTENKNSFSKHRNTDQGKLTLVGSFSSEERTATKMPVIYDSVHDICGNIFRESKTKQ